MSRNLARPYFPIPPRDYSQPYFAEIIRSFSTYIGQQNNPGAMRATELTLTDDLGNVDHGKLSWNDDDVTLDLTMGSGVVQQVGLETYYRIKADSDIADGEVVMFTGSLGASSKLTGAPASAGLTNGFLIMGVATQAIATNDVGFVTNFGIVRGIDTSAFSDGEILYYDPSVVGGLTNVEPDPAYARVIVAAVVNAGAGGSGSLFVRPTVIPSFNATGHPIKLVTSSYPIVERDYTILCDATSGPLTVTLPAAGGVFNGHVINIKKVDSTVNAVIIDADGSDTIDGSATVSTDVQWTTITVQANGSAWYII